MQVMIVSRRVILVSVLMLIATGGSLAQTSNQDPTIADLQHQIHEMRSQMAKMQNRIAELETTKGKAAATSSSGPALPESETPPTQALPFRPDEAKSPEEPASFQYKGLSLTPGGFLEGTMLVRTRNENADIANNYSAIPLNGSSNAKLSEFRGTARNSEFSLLIQGTAGTTRINEVDALIPLPPLLGRIPFLGSKRARGGKCDATSIALTTVLPTAAAKSLGIQDKI
jgi:uncharacterized coiled-coil protein SlyX